MSNTPRLGAPELAAAQALPETTVNEQLRYAEQGAGFFIVKDKDLTAPPGSPADGDAYIVAASPTGAWTGKAKSIAFYMNTGWLFVTPIAGTTAFLQDEALSYRYSGSAWAATTAPGVGTAAALNIDTDGTLAANSDSLIATQKAVKTAIATAVTGLLDFKGSTDCSANPNYPAASKGDTYVVTVAGKIGGASGTSMDVGDSYIATADNAGGTQASVGASWMTLEHNGVFGAGVSLNSTTDILTGTDTAKAATADSIAALWEQGADVASAGTTSLGEGGYFNITGTTTITDVDFATDHAGRTAWVKFAGVLTLTHNASTLILPTGASITTAAGDTACFVSEGSDVIRCVAYVRANGQALASGISTNEASSSEMWTGTSSTKIVTPKKILDGAIPTALVDGATVTPDFNAGFNFEWTIGGNRTLANPTNAKSGQSGTIKIVQDATGTRVITYGNNWRFPGGSATGGLLSTAANAIDLIAFTVGSDGKIYATLSKAFAA